ncbi:FUSC family protein [Candidatus Pantoea persica]|uniref:FUSC family protein n=1 Tax=Candidatus Pantoea persica TaxID=2518128 RepID=UPI002867D4ED|nr:FUSC family protein [Candidatus Pantoea persica]
MPLELCVGYGFIQVIGVERGYWILLTSLFVCQPNYNATRRQLALHIAGTLAGVAIGLPLLWLVPSTEGQLILIVVSGVLFFAFRQVQYAQATLFITLLVLFCFNLPGRRIRRGAAAHRRYAAGVRARLAGGALYLARLALPSAARGGGAHA